MDVLEYLRDDDGGGEDDSDPVVDIGGRGRARHRAIANAIVIPQTALEECRHRSLVMYRRATDLVRSSGGRRNGRPVIVFADAHHVDTQIRPPLSSSNSNSAAAAPDEDDDDHYDEDATTINDVNDARLRGVALFYGRSLSRDDDVDDGGSTSFTRRRRKVEVVFLSDDAASRGMALLEGWRGDGVRHYYEARSVRDHVTLLQTEDPTLNLLDMVAHFGGGGGILSPPPGLEADVTPSTTTTTIAPYEPHVSSSDLSRGLRANRYHQGVYRSDRDSHTGGYVTLRRGEERVAVVVRGRTDVNRAVDGDIVAVELFAIERWLSAFDDDDEGGGGHRGSETMTSGGEDAAAGGGRTGIAADTAEPTVRDIDNIAEEVPVDDEGRTLRRPTGRVVGIIRRNFHNRNFCGSICTVDDAVAARRKEKGAGGGDGTDHDDYDEDDGMECPVHPHDAIVARHEREHPDGITSTVVFFSIDQRVPPILLRTTQRERLVGMRILVSMDSWPADSEYPLGHYVQTLGVAGTKDTETQVLLQEFSIPCEPLKGNVDRYAFSVLWEVTLEAEIVDVEFKKSIIHSIAALTYQQAQSLIDKPDKDCKDDIQAGAVKRLASLARKFRERRINAGALTLASPEVKFVLDSESLNPTDVQAYTLYEANALVEEFMLLANVTVAKKILRHYPTLSILRRHPAPNRSMFDSLIQKAKTRGISLCIDDSKKLADSLDDAGRILSADPYLDQLLRILSTRCMSPAQYFCSGEYQAKDWHHYGLAAPVYTHFTSPIRRYADVCVHRLLAAAIGVAPLPVFLSSKSHLHDLAANMNRRHRAAQLAGRASVQLHTLIFFAGGEDGGEGGGAKEEDAYVLDLETSSNAEPSFTVMVPRYGIEGRVRLTKLGKHECLIRDPERHKLGIKDAITGETLASVTVFDKVRVKIWVRSSRDQRELVLDLLEPKILADPNLQSDGNSKAVRLETKKKKQKTMSRDLQVP
ncbi:hypothetical protein ACHAXA_004436 [Cyclostephanos tholiformis]|uniref:RNB domain-containing protein n=1 Tax=Cyclostephanos tholiformis TaxID=382380 RepID=A0ABD3SBN1_9STRA